MIPRRTRRGDHAAAGHWRRWEALAIAIAATLALVHDLHERLVRPAAGESGAGQLWHAVASVALVALIRLATHVVAPAVASPLLAGVGAVALGDGATHVVHLAGGQADASDTTGTLAAGAGVVLILLAAVGAFRRAEHAGCTRGPATRWADRAATLVALLGLTACVLVPVVVGTVQVHLPRRPIAPPPSVEFAAVSLHTDDGIRLQAWYRPSRNGAAVMLLNSARGDHRGSAAHARLLADHGYGVLIYDARGTGGSEGTPDGWGWTWFPDVDAGVDYLLDRPDVTHRSVGLVGLSTGADVAIQAAAKDPRIRVVVADGATAQSFADRPAGWSSALSLWPMYTTARLLAPRPTPRPLADAIAAIGPRPVLLVAAGSIPQEIPFNERYQAAGGEAVTLWRLPQERHTEGLSSEPEQYATRVLDHLDGTLLQGTSTRQ